MTDKPLLKALKERMELAGRLTQANRFDESNGIRNTVAKICEAVKDTGYHIKWEKEKHDANAVLWNTHEGNENISKNAGKLIYAYEVGMAEACEKTLKELPTNEELDALTRS